MTDQLHQAIADAIPHLPVEWLRERRWFSSKGRDVASIKLIDWGVLPIEEPGILALARVEYTTGRPEQYALPLIAAAERQPEGTRTPPATSIEDSGTTLYLYDAFQFHAFQWLLMERLIHGTLLELVHGRVIFTPEQALRESPPPLDQIRLVTAEQSNTSIIYDRQVILKVFRRVVAGVNPDVEVSRFLTTRAGFRHTPAMLGSISYISGDGVEHSLGLLQGFVPNEGDAWELTLNELATFFADVPHDTKLASNQIEAQTRELAHKQLDEIRELGVLTGHMHVALASDPTDPDFAPRPLTPEHVTTWQAAIREQSDAVLRDLETRQDTLAREQQDDVAQLLQARDRINERIDQLTPLGTANVVVTRFHGDYHLGQVLNSEQGFLILDFEGEPLRSLEERRAHHSPLKDVAGMLRSLSYAANAGLFAAQDKAGKGSQQAQHDVAWSSAWELAAREAFLQGYLETTENAAFIPSSPELRDTTIAVFELEKALCELNYELNNRPDWLPIPLRGIQRVV